MRTRYHYASLLLFGIIFNLYFVPILGASSKPTLTATKPIAPVQPSKKEAVAQNTCETPVVTPAPETTARTSKKKSKKKKPVVQKEKRKTLRDMSYAELKVAKDKALLANDTTTALRFLEKMIPMCNDLDELRIIMLELADLLFDTGALEKAGKMYREFSTLYPGSAKVEYASYKAILCSFYATLDTERDQTKTKDTIELAETFLNRKEVFKTHIKDVTTILADCRKKLFDNESAIFSFYMHRGSYTSAQKRLEGMRKDLVAVLPEIEPQLLALECDLAEKQNHKDIVAKKQKELAEKFPAYSQQLAQAKTPKKFLGRF